MHTQLARGALALLLGLSLALGGLAQRIAGPPGALALDVTLSTCTWEAFSDTLAGIQDDGGGTLTFNCPANTEIEFPAQASISTDVTLIGDGNVTFVGGDEIIPFLVEIGASLELVGLTLRDGDGGFGGAIDNYGTLTVTNSTFSANSAGLFGGAIYNRGTLAVTNSTFSGNYGGSSGGAIYNRIDATATITASTFTDNSASAHGGAIYNGDALTVTASTFSDNSAGFNGGAIASDGTLTVMASKFSGNDGNQGGAIFDHNTLTIMASTFTGNRAEESGGAINCVLESTIIDSTFSGNTTPGDGGAIICGGSLTVAASTFSDNRANRGGAISNGGSLQLTASTLSDNSAGSLLHNNAAAITLRGSILHNPSGDNCFQLAGSITSDGSNLSDGDSCNLDAAGDQEGDGVTFNLAGLADNGGPTETMLPQAGSDAIDNADCADSSPTDQRGAARPVADCDIGAVEMDAPVPVQIVTFTSVTPTVEAEGDPVELIAIAFGPDNSNLVYTFDCDADSTYETPVAGSSTEVSGSCPAPDDGEVTVGLQVCDGGNALNCDTATAIVSASSNLPPEILNIATNSPVSQGQPVTVTVTASDPGAADVLSYSFDCDNDTAYEIGPQLANSANCALDPAQANATVSVLVADDDGGSATGSVTVSQAATLCANRYTGALATPLASGDCPPATVALTLPDEDPASLCIHAYTGQLTWAPRGACSPVHMVHVVPDDGPLDYCRNSYTNTLRYTPTGACSPVESAGVIPG